jgi:hypothetical protein
MKIGPFFLPGFTRKRKKDGGMWWEDYGLCARKNIKKIQLPSALLSGELAPQVTERLHLPFLLEAVKGKGLTSPSSDENRVRIHLS